MGIVIYSIFQHAVTKLIPQCCGAECSLPLGAMASFARNPLRMNRKKRLQSTGILCKLTLYRAAIKHSYSFLMSQELLADQCSVLFSSSTILSRCDRDVVAYDERLGPYLDESWSMVSALRNDLSSIPPLRAPPTRTGGRQTGRPWQCSHGARAHKDRAVEDVVWS